MIYSMTGYGQVKSQLENKEITVEIRCLNSKVNDFRLRIPSNYRQKELEIRRMLNDTVVRGKLDVSIDISGEGVNEDTRINTTLFKSYLNQIKDLNIDLNQVDILNALLKFPGIFETNENEISEEEFEFTSNLLQEAIEKLNDFRSIEGAVLQADMQLRVNNILKYLKEIEKYEKERIELLKEKIIKTLNSNFTNESFDKNRFEQELLYYIERLDITEEKVRLKQHCDFFIHELNIKTQTKSKKLGFVSQEIGREINTLGAKSQHHMMQKLVVEMKDELEKIKEQLNNIL
ncbi:MAG: YicC family protein [Saprospiraceae bacterium]|nr:YicC family protein [Saprospiraceae bacterium]